MTRLVKRAALALAAFSVIFAQAIAQTTPTPTGDFPVSIQIHAAQPTGTLTPIWRFFGYDEANYTYMRDGKKLLGELGQLGSPQVYIRCHHLLTSGDGKPALKWSSTNAYTEDAAGKPIYDWTLNDRIFDTYHARGLKPYVELGFMPEALSVHPQDYPHDPPPNQRVNPGSGFSYPPKDYNKWGELAYQWARHCVERYGKAEVESWYWEVWNEPNNGYWQGAHEEYFKLYDYAIAGIRRALPTARVGGPDDAGGPGGTFLHEFLEHCAHGKNYVTGGTGTPLDFIAFHAKGSPKVVSGHVEMGMDNQLRNINDAFAVIASFPQYKSTPIVIGESDPDGCAACQDPNTAYRNSTLYSSYTAAVFARKYELADKYGVNLQGALTWAFEFENQPYFAGFRVLATNGIDLPVLNVFRMFAKMNGQRVAVESTSAYSAADIQQKGVRQSPDVSALASRDGNKITILAWHYHDDDVSGPNANVTFTVDGLASGQAVEMTRYLIDQTQTNAYTAWLKMGSPPNPTPAQYAQLEKTGHLSPLGASQKIVPDHGALHFSASLPRQAVALFVIQPHA